MKIFSIYDNKTELYARPFFEHTNETALRAVKNEVNRQDINNQLHTNPEDFSLYALGTFIPESGFIEATPPTKLAECNTLLKTQGDK